MKNPVALVAFASLFALCGCTGGGDPDVADVTGVVTVNGKPIDYALISFMPTEGRASVGRTDANGAYKLAYVGKQNGAKIGKHKITIETRVVAETNYGGEDTSESNDGNHVRFTGRKELLPKKYCDRRLTELTATVEKGKNTIDFDLEAE